jgi:hypothetical protein
MPFNTSETVVCDTPARLATSTIVDFRALLIPHRPCSRDRRTSTAVAGTAQAIGCRYSTLSLSGPKRIGKPDHF